MATTTITSKAQATIPKEVRDHLHLRPGDRLEFVVEPDERVVSVPATLDVADVQGILPAPERPVSLEQMDAAIRERVSGQ